MHGNDLRMTRRDTLIGAAGASLALGAGAAHAAERPIRIRHYVIATHDMNFVCDQIYEVLGLPPTPKKEGPGVTEAFGFYSTMIRVGTTMLEVVQPIKNDHLLSRWFVENGGDGGFMVVLQTFDADALKARAKAENLTLTRDMRFKGQHMLQFDYKHFATHFELYKYTPEEDWWGNPRTGPYGESRVATDIIGCEVAVEDPAAISAQIARLFVGQQTGTQVRLDDRFVDFTPVQGGKRGLTTLHLKARDKLRVGDWARIGGVKFKFV